MMRNIKTRDGFEFWDKLNALPRYAFLLSPSGKSVQKFEDQAMGNWVDVHEAQQIIDQAEERISERQDELGEVSRQLEKFRSRSHGIKNLSAIEARDDQIGAASLKINALQQRLTAADERVDVLEGLLASAYETAAKWVEKRMDDYINEHGNQDPETGCLELPGTGDEYVGELMEIVDGIRALKPAEGGGDEVMSFAQIAQFNDDNDHRPERDE